MKKKLQLFIGLLCYIVGIIISIYIGGVVMILHPVQSLYIGFLERSLDLRLIFVCGMKILLSTTIAGLIWCVGYIVLNYCKGTEDPDWDEIEERKA